MSHRLRPRINGVQINYEIDGNGPPLVLVHGLGGSLRVWDEVVPTLAAHRTVIRLDLRGFGRSDRPGEPAALRLYASDVAGLLERLSIPCAAVMGHSLGGSVTLEFGLAFPHRTSALIVVGGTPRLTPQGEALFRERAHLAESDGLDAVAEAGRETAFPSAALRRRPELRERYTHMVLGNSVPDYVWGCQTLVQIDLTERLRYIARPTLVIVGELDQVCPPDSSRLIAQQVPGAELELLPGIGHMVAWEAPHVLAERALAFLALHGG